MLSFTRTVDRAMSSAKTATPDGRATRDRGAKRPDRRLQRCTRWGAGCWPVNASWRLGP